MKLSSILVIILSVVSVFAGILILLTLLVPLLLVSFLIGVILLGILLGWTVTKYYYNKLVIKLGKSNWVINSDSTRSLRLEVDKSKVEKGLNELKDKLSKFSNIFNK